MRRVSIKGMGMVVPGMREEPDGLLRALEKTPVRPPKTVEQVPLPAGMKPQDVRRMARLTRLSLAAADRSFDHAEMHGRDASLYIGLTHGATSLLKEFLDFLYDYGPDMASPNAFSNGVTGAALGAVSKHLHLTRGGFTIAGFENAGLETLAAAADALDRGETDLCCAGAAEEYSPYVEDAYASCGYYPGDMPLALPAVEKTNKGVGVSEASVFFVLAHENCAGGCCGVYEPLDDPCAAPPDVDVVISGAGGGPQDAHELDALRRAATCFASPPALLFPKMWFGETFAVAPLISVAIACQMMANPWPVFVTPLHASLQPLYRSAPIAARPCATVLVIAASRTGEVSAGIVRRPMA